MSRVEPSIHRTDFSCPHCQAHAAQDWYNLYASKITGERRHPFFPKGSVDDIDLSGDATSQQVEEARTWLRRVAARELFLEPLEKSRSVYQSLENVFITECFNCHKLALWVGGKLTDPSMRAGATPNPDIEEHIRADIEEARSILGSSPRGAAAILRLALQKLCVQLGEPGKKIDTDIKSLVAKGLDPHLQRAFDIVRVMGNEAVHPGILDLRDDAETAAELINLINIVAQTMITNKKAIDALYSRLPADKVAGIEARDKKPRG